MELQVFAWGSSHWWVTKVLLKPQWFPRLLNFFPCFWGVLRTGKTLDPISVLWGMEVTPPALQ